MRPEDVDVSRGRRRSRSDRRARDPARPLQGARAAPSAASILRAFVGPDLAAGRAAARSLRARASSTATASLSESEQPVAVRVSVLAIAHRGDPVAERENTLAAFAAAVAAGAEMIELDVRRTADGAAVVVHDPTLERLWGVARRVAGVDRRRGAARSASPTCARRCRDPGRRAGDGRLRGARRGGAGARGGARAADALDRCLFSGDCYDGHRAIRAAAPHARIAVTWTRDEPCPDDAPRRARGRVLEPERQRRSRGTATRSSGCTRAARSSPSGRSTAVRTCSVFVDLGVDAVITNRIADLVELLERVC